MGVSPVRLMEGTMLNDAEPDALLVLKLLSPL